MIKNSVAFGFECVLLYLYMIGSMASEMKTFSYDSKCSESIFLFHQQVFEMKPPFTISIFPLRMVLKVVLNFHFSCFFH